LDLEEHNKNLDARCKMVSVKDHHRFMDRAIELAKLGGKRVRTNPLVGSVIVHENQIIGEGYHEIFGGNHAERNAINNALEFHSIEKVASATLYVTLEPCCIYGKTPPCLDYILKHDIQKVVVGTRDPNPKMNGKSLDLLKSHKIGVVEGIRQKECEDLIAPFKVNLQKRPYVILKWAQSKDFYIGKEDEQVWLSNKYSNILNHKWRTEVDGILVGTNTAVIDNPKLTAREFEGENPTRILLDRTGRVPKTHHLLADEEKTIIFTQQEKLKLGLCKKIIKPSEYTPEVILSKLFEEGILAVLIEGGAKVLKSFIKYNIWDEARVIYTQKMLNSGIKSPTLMGRIYKKWHLESDQIVRILNVSHK